MRSMRLMRMVFLLPVLLSLAGCTFAASVPGSVRELDFGGQQWRIKSSGTPIGPGPNLWSADPGAVWLDEKGMHLTISNRGGQWYATEIFTRRPTGYGTYTFSIDSDIAAYEPSVVAGFFTWDNRPDEANREIDIEFASWGMPGGAKGQYVVQPYVTSDHLHLFDHHLDGTWSTHRLVWTPDRVEFSSWHGQVDPDDPSAHGMLMQRWVYPGKSPSEGNARFRINLWLFEGRPVNQPVQLTIRSFSFVPYGGR